MTEATQIPPDEHRHQIERYTAVRPVYVVFAEVLERALRKACAVSIPEAVVQSRAKTVSSFAEKCVRKYPKYKDPVNQFSDLCGARVLVQTLEQVLSVRRFIESHFRIHDNDDKALSLGEDTFGYRDMHYVVSLRPDRCGALGIAAAEQDRIGTRCAEIQVRTWLQHAWADTLHDRVYKNPLTVPRNLRRLGALQAALMEEADRNFDEMADALDGMIANYAAFADREAVEKEIEVQGLLLENEPREEKKPGLAIRLARMLAACGAYEEAVDVLRPYRDQKGPTRCQLISELGYALCKLARAEPSGQRYTRGLELLSEAVDCESSGRPYVLDLRGSRSRRARAHYRLAWALEMIPGEKRRAREQYQRAHELEPGNPYYLAAMLGFEFVTTRERALLVPMRGAMQEGVATCRSHAVAGIELPDAYFTAGRLSLLLDRTGKKAGFEAFGYYARGLRHVLQGEYCVPPELIREETEWIRELRGGDEPAPSSLWALRLLELGERVAGLDADLASPHRVLIVAGGAASMDAEAVGEIRPLLEAALEGFEGKVISGGTRSGVPGCVGAVAAELEAEGRKRFDLVGYIPTHLPQDAPRDDRYDDLVVCGEGAFSPEQLLQTWTDLLEDGVAPRDVTLLGFGGGPVSAAEYRLALALGGSVAIVTGTEGTADELLEDELWSPLRNLLPIPRDLAAVRALVRSPADEFSPDVLEQMAASFHEAYLAMSTSKLPEPLRPWPELAETYKSANREQARSSVAILEAHGFGVRGSASPTVLELDRDDPRVEAMAEAEHGRWVIDRLRDGWRLGPRDDDQKRHPLLVPWEKVPEDIREYDVNAVLNFAKILAAAGLEVYGSE